MEKINKEINTFCINFSNTANKKTTAVLFGFNDNLMQSNFGSGKEVIISPSYNIPSPDVTYLQLLVDSCYKPFKIKEIKLCGKFSDIKGLILWVQSKNMNGSNNPPTLIFINNHINAELYSKREVTDDIVVIIPCFIRIDANTFIRCWMKPNSKINFQIKI